MTTETTNDRIMAARLARALKDREELTRLRDLAYQLNSAVLALGDRLERRGREETGQHGPPAAPLWMRLSRAIDRVMTAGSTHEDQERAELVFAELPEGDADWNYSWDCIDDHDADAQGYIMLGLRIDSTRASLAEPGVSRTARVNIHPDLSWGFHLAPIGGDEPGDVPFQVVLQAVSALHKALEKIGVND